MLHFFWKKYHGDDLEMSESDVGPRAYWRHIASRCHVMKNGNTLRIFPDTKGDRDRHGLIE